MKEVAKPDHDVIIIGGGPAGSTTACYLAREGMKVLVVEKEKFPRPHIGESLVPATTKIFKELGFLETMEKAGFVRKYGAAWTSASQASLYSHNFEDLGKDYEVDVKFAERASMDGYSQNYTYHVDRGKFDDLLLKHARSLGAEVWEETVIRDIDFGSQPLVKVKCRRKQTGEETTLSCRMVVDASGRGTFLGSKLRLKVNDPQFDQNAVYSWFEGFDRSHPDKEDFIFIHFLPKISGWVWQIPVTDTITSIGVVTPRRHFGGRGDTREAFFWECIDSRPELGEKLRAAKRIREFEAEGDYSYAVKQIAGDRWVLVGDAARFIDPIFSSGVSIAMTSARFASQAILQAGQVSDFCHQCFEEYERRMRSGCDNWYKFISIYYRLNLLFTYFVSDQRYRLDVLRLLQGDVYEEEEPEVLRRMREMVLVVEQNPEHVWHGLLNSVQDQSFKPSF